MRSGVVRLYFGTEQCCGVIVSSTHVLTSHHQLLGATQGFVDDGTARLLFPCQVVDTNPAADLAVVAVASPRPSWAPQRFGGGAAPPFGGAVDLTGFSAGDWSATATCLAPATGHGVFVVDCQARGSRSVPCHGDSGGPAWSGHTSDPTRAAEPSVVGICSEPVRHTPGCNGAQMRYAFIDDERAAWITRAMKTPYVRVPDDALAASA